MVFKVKSCLLNLLTLCVCVGGWFWCGFEGGVWCVGFVFFCFLRNEEAHREMNPDAETILLQKKDSDKGSERN